MEQLRKEIRRLREAKNLSKRALSNYTKVSDAYIVQIELGQVKSVSPEILRKLAPALGTNYRRLMELAGYLKDIDFRDETILDGKPLTDKEKAIIRLTREVEPEQKKSETLNAH